MTGYENSKLINSFHLKVDDTHELYIEEYGKKDGLPVIFLHGGPGGGISSSSKNFFNPEKYHIILFDQRGSGKSRPFLNIENNTVLHSVQDINEIAKYFDLDTFYLFGGSYGSTLALVYAIHYPERVRGLILRGIFLGRQIDIDWLYNGGAGEFFPEEFAKFRDNIPANEQDDLVYAYYRRIIGADIFVRNEACKSWSDWESSVSKLTPEFPDSTADVTDPELSIATMEAHYFANRMFWFEDDYILNRVDKLNGVPIYIFHGRYDTVCMPSAAYELAEALPHANLKFVENAGHSAFDPEMFKELVNFMDAM